MRILFVTNHHPTAETPGNSPCVEQQRQALQRLGYKVDVLFINGEKTRLNYLKGMWSVFWNVQIRNKYDLVHAHYGYCGYVARTQLRRPVVVTFRGSDVFAKYERPLSRWIARYVNQTIVMTGQMKKVLGQASAQVIPYGIDFELFKPMALPEARQVLGLPLAAPLILFPYEPARPMKRYDLVEQAVERLKDQFPEVQLVCIYDKPHAVVAQYMNACDALVLASDWEGAPVAIREAMACNLPVVSVDVGDAAQIIGKTEGCYICQKTPADIAAKLSNVLQARKRTEGRTAVLDLDLNKSAADVAVIYQKLLDGASPSRSPEVMAFD